MLRIYIYDISRLRVNRTGIFSIDFLKYSNINFHGNPSCGASRFMQMNGRPDSETNRRDETNCRFSQILRTNLIMKNSDDAKMVNVYLDADFTATGQLQNQH